MNDNRQTHIRESAWEIAFSITKQHLPLLCWPRQAKLRKSFLHSPVLLQGANFLKKSPFSFYLCEVHTYLAWRSLFLLMMGSWKRVIIPEFIENVRRNYIHHFHTLRFVYLSNRLCLRWIVETYEFIMVLESIPMCDSFLALSLLRWRQWLM